MPVSNITSNSSAAINSGSPRRSSLATVSGQKLSQIEPMQEIASEIEKGVRLAYQSLRSSTTGQIDLSKPKEIVSSVSKELENNASKSSGDHQLLIKANNQLNNFITQSERNLKGDNKKIEKSKLTALSDAAKALSELQKKGILKPKLTELAIKKEAQIQL